MIIDFHTHCFSGAVVEKAMASLTALSQYKPYLDGTKEELLQSMDKAGIDKSVILNIATNPRQNAKVNDWAIELAKSERLIPFGSIHPFNEDYKLEADRLYDSGIKGIKFHPDYQGFNVDDGRALMVYEYLFKKGFTVIFHCGNDLPRRDELCCPPIRFERVVNAFSGEKLVGAHLGGQGLWEDVFLRIAGKNVYLDTSFGFKFLAPAQIEKMIQIHGEDRLLFATDSPWQDQKTEVEEMRGFVKDEYVLKKILGENAKRLLQI